MLQTFFLKIILFIFTLFITINSVASTPKITTNAFTIHLPNKMTLVSQSPDAVNKIYQFVFQTPTQDATSQQIRVTAVGKAPENPADYQKWKTQVLGGNIALFADSYHLDLSKQKEVLGKKPEIMTLGNHVFSTASMTFDTMQTYFLVTVIKKSTYALVLVSKSKDAKIRKMKMDKLIESIKSINYLGATG